MSRLGAVLWDMDGLLVDSEPVWTVAERELCASWGVEFRAETKAAMIGRRLDESMPILIAASGVQADPVQAGNWLLGRMVELFGRGVALRPGAAALLAELAAAGVPQALVSSSFRVLVDALALSLPPPLRGVFAITVAGDEVPVAKPDPAGYLRAAAALGVEPSRCAVLEDSAAGAQAGVAAGCAVLVVPSVAAVPELAGCTRVASLTEVRMADLAALLPAEATLASPRLRLRPLPWSAVRTLAEGGRRTDWAPDYPATGDTVIARVLHAAGPAPPDPWGHRQLVERATGLVVGGVGLFGAPATGELEIGYGVVGSRQGRGYATEAVRALTDWVWHDPRTRLVIAGTAPGNRASQRVLEKAGFAAAGRRGEELLFRLDRP